MKLELWRPLIDLENDWESMFRFPRFVSEGFEFPFRPSMDVTRTDRELIVMAAIPLTDGMEGVRGLQDDDLVGDPLERAG